MNVVDLPAKEGSPEALRQALEQMKARTPLLLEYAEITAQIAFKKYKILTSNGFTEAQAIELLKGTV